MMTLLGPLLGLSLLGAPPVFVDERDDIPWIVVAAPGARCGAVRLAQGLRAERSKLVAALDKQQDPPVTKASSTPRLPLLLGLGLLGTEGEVLVIAVEQALARQGIGGPVRLRVENTAAWLELPTLSPAAASALATAAFSSTELLSFRELASARLARRRSAIGGSATERAVRWSCFAVDDDPALPLDLGRRLRVRLAAPLLP